MSAAVGAGREGSPKKTGARGRTAAGPGRCEVGGDCLFLADDVAVVADNHAVPLLAVLGHVGHGALAGLGALVSVIFSVIIFIAIFAFAFSIGTATSMI